mgnify:CR=1 FL=1
MFSCTVVYITATLHDDVRFEYLAVLLFILQRRSMMMQGLNVWLYYQQKHITGVM